MISDTACAVAETGQSEDLSARRSTQARKSDPIDAVRPIAIQEHVGRPDEEGLIAAVENMGARRRRRLLPLDPVPFAAQPPRVLHGSSRDLSSRGVPVGRDSGNTTGPLSAPSEREGR